MIFFQLEIGEIKGITRLFSSKSVLKFKGITRLFSIERTFRNISTTNVAESTTNVAESTLNEEKSLVIPLIFSTLLLCRVYRHGFENVLLFNLLNQRKSNCLYLDFKLCSECFYKQVS